MISLIIATYNSEKYIEFCIKSIIAQTYEPIEFIIIDGNSTDNTIPIIKNLLNIDHLILISEKDKGIYDALNKGLNFTSGDIIGFVHSDDFLASKDIINNIVSMIKSESLDGVYGDLQYVNKINSKKIIRNWKSSNFKSDLLKKGWMPPHPTLFLKKEVYEKHGLFDLSYKISADYDFMLRVFKDSELKFGYLPKVVTKMRVGGASNRSLKNIVIKMIEDYRAIRKNKIGGIFTLILKNTSKIKQFFS